MERVAVVALALGVLLWVTWPLIKGMKGEKRLCPSCGTPYRPDDKYCSRCGRKLVKEG
ncbi:MAG: zinc-ribbon domain-containing protein [Anaerolineae bacterium]|nr:zinc-ribbon domain-containing protein [Anaerolineae bacterium]MDW8102363.1 zinc-ribbon domain-containing protein [Anaerolineae bacterium]